MYVIQILDYIVTRVPKLDCGRLVDIKKYFIVTELFHIQQQQQLISSSILCIQQQQHSMCACSFDTNM